MGYPTPSTPTNLRWKLPPAYCIVSEIFRADSITSQRRAVLATLLDTLSKEIGLRYYQPPSILDNQSIVSHYKHTNIMKNIIIVLSFVIGLTSCSSSGNRPVLIKYVADNRGLISVEYTVRDSSYALDYITSDQFETMFGYAPTITKPESIGDETVKAVVIENGTTTYAHLSDPERFTLSPGDSVWLNLDTHLIDNKDTNAMKVVLFRP